MESWLTETNLPIEYQQSFTDDIQQALYKKILPM